MGKIYASPPEIEVPEFKSGEPWQDYEKRCDTHVKAVKQWAKTNGAGPEAGQEVDFPQGDGYARYIVFSLKPVKLIHLNVGDAWQYPYAHRLTASDIRDVLRKDSSLKSFFSKKAA